MSAADRKPRGLFVTGTDTGVGKSVVTACIVSALASNGVNAGIMKPVETGIRSEELSDSKWLASVTGVRDAPDLVTPFRFTLPASPLVAAAQAGRTITPAVILDAFHALARAHECLVVEGIGGVLVPITSELFVAGLITQMDLPALIVARPALGSINHTLLTVESLRQRGVPILGLVFNHAIPPAAPDPSETVPTILKCSGLRSFGELPYCDGLPSAWDRQRDILIARLDVQGLLEALGFRGIA